MHERMKSREILNTTKLYLFRGFCKIVPSIHVQTKPFKMLHGVLIHSYKLHFQNRSYRDSFLCNLWKTGSRGLSLPRFHFTCLPNEFFQSRDARIHAWHVGNGLLDFEYESDNWHMFVMLNKGHWYMML